MYYALYTPYGFLRPRAGNAPDELHIFTNMAERDAWVEADPYIGPDARRDALSYIQARDAWRQWGTRCGWHGGHPTYEYLPPWEQGRSPWNEPHVDERREPCGMQ